jgi:uncharacterized protein
MRVDAAHEGAIFIPSMNFEFDPAKSSANKEKHNIDFLDAQKLWDDVDRALLPAKNKSEPRQLLLARWNGKLWAAIFTERGDNIRIISVRRARKNEEAVYEQTQDEDDNNES